MSAATKGAKAPAAASVVTKATGGTVDAPIGISSPALERDALLLQAIARDEAAVAALLAVLSTDGSNLVGDALANIRDDLGALSEALMTSETPVSRLESTLYRFTHRIEAIRAVHEAIRKATA